MSQSQPPRDPDREPARLDAHRAARQRGRRADDTAATDPGDQTAAPASFEESPAVQRARRIDDLRERVESGEYRPDPGKTAESMLENERS